MISRDILEDKEKIYTLTKSAFDAIDIDHSGWIEKEEIENCLLEICKDQKLATPSSEEFDVVFAELDRGNLGKINIEQFEIFITQTLNIMRNDETK